MASSTVSYRILNESDYKVTMELFLKFFLPYEPVAIAAGLRSGDAVNLYDLVWQGLWQSVSLGAFDDGTGDMCGARINFLSQNFDKLDPPKSHTPESEKKVLRLLDVVKSNLENFLEGTKKYMDHVVVTVNPAYGRRGIGAELYKRSESLAREHGCENMVAVCTSYYTRKITLKHGYTMAKEIFYSEYVDEVYNEKIFAKVQPPHTGAALMIKAVKPHDIEDIAEIV